MAKSKNNKPQFRDVSGLGWEATHFTYPKRDPSITPAAFGIYPTAAGIQQNLNAQQVPGTRSLLSAPSPMPQMLPSPAPQQINPATANVPNAEKVVPLSQQPEERQVVKDYLANPQMLKPPPTSQSAVLSFMSTLFNTSDTFDPAKESPENPSGFVGGDVPLESQWDGMLRGLQWGYDRWNQAFSFGTSLAPGGIDTLSWDDANEVSYGQAQTAAGAINRAKYGMAGDVLNFFTGPGATAAGGAAESMPIGVDFDITDPQQRKAAFEDSEVGKWTSGLIDTAFTIFMDPLVFGGKALKITRLRYLDRAIDSPERRAEVISDLDKGAAVVNPARAQNTGLAEAVARQEALAGQAPTGDVDQFAGLAPLARLAAWSTQKGPDGRKIVSQGEIFRHRVVRWATNRDGLAAALHNAENYDEAALILKSAAGDISAQQQLMVLRADLAVALGDGQRDLMFTKMLVNPAEKTALYKTADEAAKKARETVKKLRAEGMQDTHLYRMAESRLAQAVETRRFVRTFDISKVDPLDPLVAKSSQAAEVAQRAVNEMRRRDAYFWRAYTAERDKYGPYFGSLLGSTRGPSKNNAFGRMVEASRESRATAAYEAASSRGRRIVKPDGTVVVPRVWKPQTWRGMWQADEFGNNGFTRGLRLWRWSGEERPSGNIITRGIGAQESYREIEAQLNVLNIYSGASRSVTIVKTVRDKKGQLIVVKDKQTGKPVVETIEIGGVKRKQQLLQAYNDALTATVRGDMDAKRAIDMIEEQVMNDIGAWNGMDAITVRQVYQQTAGKRDELVESIRNNGYWVENGTVESSPWLETHLQNSTYLIPLEDFERKARLWVQTGWQKKLEESGYGLIDKLDSAYSVFNDLWRPATLLRLGYPQRNVAEGVMRATAFEFSLDPVRDLVVQGGYGVRNAWVKRHMAPAMKQAERIMAEQPGVRAGKPMPRQFVKWRATQIAARDQDIANHLLTLKRVGTLVADRSVAFRKEQIAFWSAELADSNRKLKAMTSSGAAADAVAVERGYMEIVDSTLTELRAIKAKNNPGPDVDEIIDDWRYMASLLEDSRIQRTNLDDDVISVALFRDQGAAKRRVHDGSITGPDHRTYQAAFNEDSPFTPMALMMSSGDNTYKSMIALRMDVTNRALKATVTKYNVNVNPDRPEYFDAVATALRQFKNSSVGQKVVRGEPVRDIVKWLQGTPEGREVAAFVTKGQVPQKGARRITVVDKKTATDYVKLLYERYLNLAPTPQIRDYVRANNLGTMDAGAAGWNGRVVETLIGQKDQAGQFINPLKPVVGNIIMETGTFRKIPEWYKSVVDTGMKWLGTYPENAFVRHPFYGRRYEATFQQVMRTIMDQTPGDYISMGAVNQAYRLAHRRALKDTKDWLYTIDRRTNLGTYGEYVWPFISATQNSVTTLGRLVWNDPSIAAIAVNLWNAPQKLGLEDEKGDLLIPLPKFLIPDAVEKAVGIDNMTTMRFSKSSFNLFLPETGFFIFPRPGPLLAVPASELLKNGWFGASPTTPGPLKAVFGDETGDKIWALAKDYTFGQEGGASPETLSWDLILPPMVARPLQAFLGNSNRQFALQYSLQIRTEMAKMMAGQRDTPQTADEIADFKNEIMWRTRGFMMLRWLGNATAFTPPQYDSTLKPLMDTINWYEQNYGLDGSRMANENLGPLLMMVGNWSNTRNIAGMPATEKSVAAAKRYSGIIERLAPEFQQTGDLSVLSMLVNMDNAQGLFDQSAYAWQFSNEVNGITDAFRELQTPEMGLVESQKNAGWAEWLSKVGVIDSLLQQAGYTSYRSAGAAQYRQMKEAVTNEMMQDPLFQGWAGDKEDIGGTRTRSAIRLLEAALSDKTFVEDNFTDDGQMNTIAEASWYYLSIRKRVVDALASTGKGINHDDNIQVRNFWDEQRQSLINQVPGWGIFANRYLDGDDDPENPGAQLGVSYSMTGGVNVSSNY